MGLFSFLTGKDADRDVKEVQDVKAPSDVKESTPATRDASDWSAGSDTPFHPPEAWNTDALTAPKPVQAGEVPQVGAPDAALTAEYQQKIIDVVKTVFDPEIPVDIYELGLIYDIIVDADRKVLIKMTLTSPACPSAQQLPQ